MNKYILLALSLCLSAGAFAQPVAPKKHPMATVRADVSDKDRKKQENEAVKRLTKACNELALNPESVQAQKAYIEAQRAWIQQKKQHRKLQEEYRIAIRNGGTVTFTKDSLLRQAQRDFQQARERFADAMDDPAAQKALVDAQKALSQAEKATAPLILVDGKEVWAMSAVNSDSIRSITVLKDEAAIKKYGDKGRYGVVLITSGAPQPKKSMEQARLEFLSEAIELTAGQKEAFEKTYTAMNKQIEELRRANNELADKVSGKQTIDQVLKNNIVIEQKRQEMYKALGKTLSDEQLAKLYRADLQFARRMMGPGKNPKAVIHRDGMPRPDDAGKKDGKR